MSIYTKPASEADVNVSSDKQIAKLIYQHWMSNMKFTLDIEEQKYDDGRNNPKFRFFKKMLMANTYEKMRTLFKELSKIGVIQPTEQLEDVRDGYKPTKSGGCGYVNTDKVDDVLNDPEPPKIEKKTRKAAQ